MTTYIYRVMGSANKKTGKRSWYKVKLREGKLIDCSCPAREFRKYSPCKHMKLITERLGHPC
jgi:hypothetical protein